MAIDFDSDRDVPLLAIFGVCLIICFYMVQIIVSYTPFSYAYVWLCGVTGFMPAVVGPMAHYYGYMNGKTRISYPIVAIAIVFGGAITFLFYANGAWDEEEPAITQAKIVDLHRWDWKGYTNYSATVETESGKGRISLATVVAESASIGDSVPVAIHLGRFGIPWAGVARPPEEESP